MPVRKIKQTAAGAAYIVANVNLKNAGTFTCNVQMRVLTARSAANRLSGHTSDFTVNSTTYTAGVYTEASCEADGGAWVTKGWCSGGDSTTDYLFGDKYSDCIADNGTFTFNNWGEWYDSISYKTDEVSTSGNTTGHVCVEDFRDTTDEVTSKTNSWWSANRDTTTDTLQYFVQNIGCTEPTEGWTTQYKGMAYLDKENKQLTLKSATDELVADMWLVSDELYYTAYSTGSYLFVKEVANTTNPTLLNNFEVYHVTSSPRGGGRVLFDGLNFSDNSYTFGDLDPSAEDVAGSISQSSGLTGRVQTMVTYD